MYLVLKKRVMRLLRKCSRILIDVLMYPNKIRISLVNRGMIRIWQNLYMQMQEINGLEY